MPVIRTLRVSVLAFALVTTAAACGSSTKTTAAEPAATTAAAATTVAAAATTAAPAATTAAATTAAPAATTAAPAATTAKPADSTAAPAAGGAAAAACSGLGAAGTGASTIDVSLLEWDIKSPASVKSGKVTMNVKNDGKNPHELAIVKGESYEALPKLANGAVDEPKLTAGDLLGRTQKLKGGEVCGATLDLAPGKYVLVCNIQFGEISHAGKGQKLNFEVTA
jgi:hypothetical protein